MKSRRLLVGTSLGSLPAAQGTHPPGWFYLQPTNNTSKVSTQVLSVIHRQVVQDLWLRWMKWWWHQPTWRSAEQETPIPTGQEAPWRGNLTTRTSWTKYFPPNCAPIPICWLSSWILCSNSTSRNALPCSLPSNNIIRLNTQLYISGAFLQNN